MKIGVYLSVETVAVLLMAARDRLTPIDRAALIRAVEEAADALQAADFRASLGARGSIISAGDRSKPK